MLNKYNLLIVFINIVTSIMFGLAGGMLYSALYLTSKSDPHSQSGVFFTASQTDPFAILALIVGVLGLTVGTSVILPHYVSGQLVKTQARSVLQEAMTDVQSDLVRNLRETRKTDAHVSRMIGIHESRTGSLVWSIGWLTRSLKRYVRLLPDNPHYNEFIILNLDVLCASVERVVPLNMGKAYYYYNAGEDYLLNLAMHRIYSNSVESEERSTRPAIRACKDLSDLVILIKRGMNESPPDQLFNSLNGLDYRKIKRGSEVIYYFTSCLLTALMSKHPEYLDSGKYGFLAEANQRRFAAEISILSNEKDSYETCLELIQIPFREGYTKLQDALKEYLH